MKQDQFNNFNTRNNLKMLKKKEDVHLSQKQTVSYK